MREEEADRLLDLRADGVRQMREVFLYRTVHINGVPKQIKDGSVRRVTFQDTVTWVKVYRRDGAICAGYKGPGMPVMQLVRG